MTKDEKEFEKWIQEREKNETKMQKLKEENERMARENRRLMKELLKEKDENPDIFDKDDIQNIEDEIQKENTKVDQARKELNKVDPLQNLEKEINDSSDFNVDSELQKREAEGFNDIDSYIRENEDLKKE